MVVGVWIAQWRWGCMMREKCSRGFWSFCGVYEIFAVGIELIIRSYGVQVALASPALSPIKESNDGRRR